MENCFLSIFSPMLQDFSTMLDWGVVSRLGGRRLYKAPLTIMGVDRILFGGGNTFGGLPPGGLGAEPPDALEFSKNLVNC